jgi:hydrogenase maturation protein HypF
VRPVLAVGAELKNCFCLARGHDAFMSQHIGDMNNPATLDFFEESLERLQALLDIEPEIVAADLHPDYLSSRLAANLDLPLVRVQHHWAHAASVMAEHGLKRCLAVVLDGTGYGPDGTVWGGEVLSCTLRDYNRLGRLAPLPMPGGDKAARQPWRMALAALHSAGLAEADLQTPPSVASDEDRRFILEMIDKNANCPLTSSCGRLFDAVSSLLGICHLNTFEGQAAMALEAHAACRLGSSALRNAAAAANDYLTPFTAEENSLLQIDPGPCIRRIVSMMRNKEGTTGDMALFFHLFLVTSFGNVVRYLSERTETNTIVLSGGSLQNRILLEGFIDYFSTTPLELYTNVQVPANDGGLALGQAAIGGIHVSGDSHAR